MGTELTVTHPVPAEQINLDDLPPLSDREYTFFMKILAGESPIDAYKVAWDCSTWAVGKIMKRSILLMEEPRMVACIKAARLYGLSPTDLSKAAHMRQLERQRELALISNNHGAAANLEAARGKVAGLYVDRHEYVKVFDPIAILKEMAKISPAIAKLKAEHYGVSWDQVTGEAPSPAPAPASTVTVTREAEDIEFLDPETDE
jgi:hypothetical protein